MRWIGAVFAAALALLPASPVGAQLVSPGPLAKPHAHLEGIGNCTRCHEAGEGLSEAKCLGCHRAVEATIRAGKGLHGRMEQRACEKCHPDHQGADAKLIDFGPGGMKGFDHARAGWTLEGAHRKLDCAKCHERRRVKDTTLGPRTFLGLGTRCEDCHFDEHRGQLAGKRCEQCHGLESWKPAPGLRHDQAFALTGKHEDVACAKCHPSEPAPPVDTFPAPVAEVATRFRPIAHTECSDCHRDPHAGRFGAACAQCHETQSWSKTRIAKGDFHDDTRYPLRGAHTRVACKSCHGPLPGMPQKLRGVAFDRCDRCHYDAHLGTLGPSPDCARCHDLQGFSPARFETAEHEKTPYPLAGAHTAVACRACHPVDAALMRRASPALLAMVARRKRPKLFSLAVLHPPSGGGKCDACHRDPHEGRMAKPCDACHEVASFARVALDHDKDTSWPLTGAHRKTACESCHTGDPTVYRGTPKECAGCHADVHRGQLGADCARCHATEAFLPTSFRHDDPRFTTFALEGKHAALSCDRCHRAVEGTVRYRGLPRACEGCHVDPHDGAMARYAPACASCHASESWASVSFPHDGTRFPLKGAHAEAACASCHAAGLEVKLGVACAGCHRDPHAGELGSRCASCHEETSWTGEGRAAAHRRTRFPLTGRHATIPCEECHGEVRERTFARAPTACSECHTRDLQRAALTSIDHTKAGFDDRCDTCHVPMTFERARFPDHDACFQLSRGPHRAIGCKSCHTDLTGAKADGSCNMRNAACTGCHEHSCDRTDRRHATVAGYQCKERKCWECHRFAED